MFFIHLSLKYHLLEDINHFSNAIPCLLYLQRLGTIDTDQDMQHQNKSLREWVLGGRRTTESPVSHHQPTLQRGYRLAGILSCLIHFNTVKRSLTSRHPQHRTLTSSFLPRPQDLILQWVTQQKSSPSTSRNSARFLSPGTMPHSALGFQCLTQSLQYI